MSIAADSAGPAVLPSVRAEGFRTACLAQAGGDPPQQQKAAIVYLANRPDRLVSSLFRLHQMFNCRYHYPVIVFYDRDSFPEKVKDQASTGRRP